jgi:preprotein translocase subunit SecE
MVTCVCDTPVRATVVNVTSEIKRFFSFLGNVKAEFDKVSWAGRQEVVVTTIVVFVLAIVASLFFSVVDTIIYKTVHTIIGK